MHPVTPFDANQLAKTILAFFKEQPYDAHLGMAIPGGRSPGKVLTPLANICDPSILERLHLFWVDERCVELGHADRNDTPTLKAWCDGGDAPAHVHPMPAELENLDEACQQYQHTLERYGFSDRVQHSLLGIGPDGHFASLFPNHPKLSETDMVFAIEDSPKPPPKRLSLSLEYIRASERIDVLVFGEDKGEVLRQGHESPSELIPISLLHGHANIHYHLDEDALRGYGFRN